MDDRESYSYNYGKSKPAPAGNSEKQPEIPPFANIPAEQAVLGAAMNNDFLAFELVTGFGLEAHHFFEEWHQRIFTTIAGMVGNDGGRKPNGFSVGAYFGDAVLLPTVNEKTVKLYCIELAQAIDRDCSQIGQLRELTQSIIDWHDYRAIAKIGTEAAFFPLPTNTPEMVRDNFIAALEAVPIAAAKNDRACYAVAADATALLKGDMPGRPPIPSGLADLDRYLGGGFECSSFVVMAGRPGMAKSGLALSIGRRAARKIRQDPDDEPAEQISTGYFSLEMDRRQCTARVLADKAFTADNRFKIPFESIMKDSLRAKLTPEEEWHLSLSAKALADYHLHLNYEKKLTLSQIASRARALKAKEAQQGRRLGLLIIDYVKLIKTSGVYAGQRNLEVGEISVGLKQLAEELSVCVIAISQLSRGVDQRDNHRPNLSDLALSDDLGQDADVVIFPYREFYYAEKEAKRTKKPEDVEHAEKVRYDMHLLIEKNKAGRTGEALIYCDVGCNHFENGDMRRTFGS